MSMRPQPPTDPREARRAGITIPAEGVPGATTRRRRGWATVAGVLLIFGGMEALASPYLAAFVVTLWVGWGLVIGGVAEWISAFGASENRVWKVLLGLLYLGGGFYMLAHPGAGLLALALVLAWVFLTQGVISIIGSMRLRPLPGWGWWLFDGVVTLMLAFMIFSRWPGDSVRIISLLVGIKLILSGVNRLALAMSP
jgi:uncharacterized membrane protein HdeD (DUF308 family)